MAVRPGDTVNQRDLLRKLVDLHYDRNDAVLTRGHFRVRGDTVELHPVYEQQAVRIELFGDQVERIRRFDALTGDTGDDIDELVVFSATHYGAGDETMRRAIASIETELGQRLAELQAAGKLLEAQRLRLRTEHDLEMLAEVGVCNGIENYSRHLDGRSAGEPQPHPARLLPGRLPHRDRREPRGGAPDPRPVRGGPVAQGDARRARLPTALGPRQPSPHLRRVHRAGGPGRVLVGDAGEPTSSACRARSWTRSSGPPGLVDPEVVIQPTTGQIDDLMERIHKASEAGGRSLVTTLTKKMAEDLTDYLVELGVRVRYLHSDIDTITRIELLRDLRLGEYDVLVGINLLREGLDLPEVQLVAILDADKTGFLRSASSLIQTMGRAARNVDGLVVLYADTITDAMRAAISETQRRRALQQAYNTEHGIDPTTIRKAVTDILASIRPVGAGGLGVASGAGEPGGAGPARARAGAGPAGAPARRRGGSAAGRRGQLRVRRRHLGGRRDGRAQRPPRRRAAAAGGAARTGDAPGRHRAALRGGGVVARRHRRAPPGPGRGRGGPPAHRVRSGSAGINVAVPTA